ncbi:hypothetical protein JQ609_19785 [Bradyrhizobium sp. AUGA SZCCT0169]|uniref:hypothetical protein n=1 Tax=unclassified Bradyrhizobium TaxID=2631580 RepID=UPI001BA45A94|nr:MULTISPECIES: hypothetical protein [unclassified Bradyrhizobium]MBR1194352.1 hypothetical protein [Bradyrhizobium sp. AUGA SZCCT0160]MBR1249156.1 hypothetical protein [Bradyrhizobium sp. AUGA SZCCT0169]
MNRPALQVVAALPLLALAALLLAFDVHPMVLAIIGVVVAIPIVALLALFAVAMVLTVKAEQLGGSGIE